MQAPNFRQADTKPVYGVAIPTAQGVRDVLAAAGCYCGDGAHPCNWHNLREEAVVYLKGSPYVLREAHRPYHNIEEYEGIDAQRLEGMEERLRLDILAEARGYGGRLLVSRESVGKNHYTNGRISHRQARHGTSRHAGTAAAAAAAACFVVYGVELRAESCPSKRGVLSLPLAEMSRVETRFNRSISD